jgi:predicted lactoylglutathione lyase
MHHAAPDQGLPKGGFPLKSLKLPFAAALACTAIVAATALPTTHATERKTMDLGNFSVSLTVKDIKAAKAFYEKLDFKEVGGKLEQNWIVLQNGNAKIGLFQGMFDKNIMTFNPGWTQDKQTLKDFQDVRELQRTLKARGLSPTTEADEATQGPAHFTLTDPDGNVLLFDQHVPSPKR